MNLSHVIIKKSKQKKKFRDTRENYEGLMNVHVVWCNVLGVFLFYINEIIINNTIWER